MIIGPQLPSLPFRPVAAGGAEDPPVEDRPLLGRVFAYDLERGVQEFDKALKERRFDEIDGMCGSAQPKVKNVLEQRAEVLWNLDLSQATPEEQKHLAKIYTGLAAHLDPPADANWFLRQFGPFLDQKPGDLSFAANHKVLRQMPPEANADVAAGMLERFKPGQRLAWPQIYTLKACAENGWQPDAEQQTTLQDRLRQNLSSSEPLVAYKRPPLQAENVLLMDLMLALPQSTDWGLERQLLDRVLTSPERQPYDFGGDTVASDCAQFFRVIARDKKLMGELMDELAASSPRNNDLYLFMAGHGNAWELAQRVEPPKSLSSAFTSVRVHVADRASRDLAKELPGLEPAAGLAAVKTYRDLWTGLNEDDLCLRGLERLQIPAEVGRLALDQDFLVAALASRTSPELKDEVMKRLDGLSFPADSLEAGQLERLRGLAFTHELRKTPMERSALLAFLARQKEAPDPIRMTEWIQAWGDVDGPESGALHKLKIDPTTAGVLLQRDALEADLGNVKQAMDKFADAAEVESMLASGELSVFCRLLDASQDLSFARTGLEAYREKLGSGMDAQTAFMQAAGSLLGAPSAPGGGLSANQGGLIVGGAFLRKRTT